MKYNELKEMKIKDWDGKPFRAIAIDDADEKLCSYDINKLDGTEKGNLICGFQNGIWTDDDNYTWTHVYPIEWNKKPKNRMNNRQLAMWVAKGNGQLKYCYLAEEADKVMDAMEARIKELEKRLEDVQNTMATENVDLGMENFKLKERVMELEAVISKMETTPSVPTTEDI